MSIDDKVTKDQRLQMIDTLTTCNTQGNVVNLILVQRDYDVRVYNFIYLFFS